ncbi:hypothetical protein [Salinarimonas sp.]|uniref:hypothetical protein n=1 Tax=Salinarimonas sp. TaxID=2766526 RepID=UPI0032D95475
MPRALVLALAIALLVAPPAAAHQPSETLLRTALVERGWFRTSVVVRLPATLLYAAAAAERAHPGEPVEAPLLIARRQGAGWDYRLDPDAPPEDLAPLLERALAVKIGGRDAQLDAVRLHHVRHAPPIGEDAEPANLADAHLSEVLVEARYRVWGGGPVVLAFPVDDVTLPPFVHLETAVEDRRTASTLWRVGPLAAPLELPAP